MSKEAYYFSHDSNAHNDPKILNLLQHEGWAGYGLYWAIVELLRNESDYRLKAQYGVYAFALRTEEERIKNVVENYELFVVDSGYFFSESLIRRMEIKETKSQKARESALSRWNKEKPDANAMRTHSEGNAIKESKVKEKKEKTTTEQSKDDYSSRFETFWGKYPKKFGKAKAYTYWKKHKCENGIFEIIMESLEAQKQSKDWIKDNGQYIPHGSTWVINRRWEDKPERSQPIQDPTYGTGKRIR